MVHHAFLIGPHTSPSSPVSLTRNCGISISSPYILKMSAPWPNPPSQAVSGDNTGQQTQPRNTYFWSANNSGIVRRQPEVRATIWIVFPNKSTPSPLPPGKLAPKGFPSNFLLLVTTYPLPLLMMLLTCLNCLSSFTNLTHSHSSNQSEGVPLYIKWKIAVSRWHKDSSQLRNIGKHTLEAQGHQEMWLFQNPSITSPGNKYRGTSYTLLDKM